jgi:Protein of unknown function (DUF3300)
MNASLRRVAFASGLLGIALLPVLAQDQPAAGPADQAAAQQTLSGEQLESMVAPIALYPDSLLSQVLVASTYPLELVEAQQFLEQNPTLKAAALVDAAKKQNWDPSVQALVAFQDVVKRLNSDIRWTTDLGNAFLAQQADVMAAVQRLRSRAKDAGKLTDTPQEKVVESNDNGKAAIEIQPVDPQIVYVPTYNPGYFWGAPGLYPWPGLYYPGIGIGWGWGPAINLGFYFPGCCGWGGWGWGFGWGGGGLFVNGPFFHRYGFSEFHGGGYGRSAWAHDPGHRGGVPYPHSVAGRFGGANARGGIAARPSSGAVRSNLSRGGDENRTNNHSAFGGTQNGNRSRQQSDHGFSSLGSQRTAPAFHGGGGGGGFHGGGGGHAGGGGHGGGGRR